MSVLIAASEDTVLLTTSAGYGFIAVVADFEAGNRNGKALLTVPDGAIVMAPIRLFDLESLSLAVLSSMGRLLIFPANNLPRLTKGKGNKLMNLDVAEGETLLRVVPIRAGARLSVKAGARIMTLTGKDLEFYRGERARRGQKLPRGFQRVDDLLVD